MQKFAAFVVQYPRTILLITLISTLLIGGGLLKLEIRNNQDSELPAEDPIVETNNRLKAVFGEKDIVLIGIESDDIFRRSTLEKIALISEELKRVDGVVGDEITSLSTLNNIEGKEWGLEVGPLMRTIPRTDA
ncbi:MAG: hypothetical protein H7Z75_18225, partial [Ferruginibacter sp.]|nr:hypothetical protein [Cytophagales bacterium]